MREQDPPRITKPLMKLDRSFGRLGLEIGRNTSKSELSTGHDVTRGIRQMVMISLSLGGRRKRVERT